MITTIQPSSLKGEILAPASKSSMQRACAAALLRAGETIIRHPGYSNDDNAALGVIQDLGAEVTNLADGSIRVRSEGIAPGAGEQAKAVSQAQADSYRQGITQGQAVSQARTNGQLVVNCGESGLGLRMFAPIIGLSSQRIRVVGEGSLLKRPMDFFDEIFPQLGVQVASNGGKLPLEIQGPLQPRDIEIDGSLSSQFLTGLLFAFGAAGASGATIRVRDLKSKPYIDLTLQVMRHFGWEVENRNYEEFLFAAKSDGQKSDGRPIQGGASGPTGGLREYTVEGDWSGGAFLLVASAIAGPVLVRGLDERSAQADKAILQALRDSGAAIPAPAAPAVLKAFRFDATDCPDLFPPLVALAAYCNGVSEISGVSRLAHKESNRGLTLQEEFGKMGVRIELDGDRMLVYGGEGVKGATVHSRHDHRIAMACAVAALKAEGPVIIEEAEAINKSYPDFYLHLQEMGAKVNIKL